MLAAYGFGAACGGYGGMVSDLLRVPYADHMLVKLPAGLDPLRVAAASDNLADAWRTVVPHLKRRPGARVLVVGGGAQSIGLYAAGLAVAHGASVVDYADDRPAAPRDRRRLRRPSDVKRPSMTSSSKRRAARAGIRSAIRSTAPGGICTAVGYYLATNTGVPLMHMYATDITLHLGVSHPRAVLPELLAWMAEHEFPAERVTTHLADFDAAPTAYATRTTKLVLHRS